MLSASNWSICWTNNVWRVIITLISKPFKRIWTKRKASSMNWAFGCSQVWISLRHRSEMKILLPHTWSLEKFLGLIWKSTDITVACFRLICSRMNLKFGRFYSNYKLAGDIRIDYRIYVLRLTSSEDKKTMKSCFTKIQSSRIIREHDSCMRHWIFDGKMESSDSQF